MWVDPSSEGFLRGVQIENFDPNSMLVAGGTGAGKHVEVFFQDKCPVPQLPKANGGHCLVVTPDNILLSCGGDASPQTCYSLDVTGGVWNHHSTLREEREGSLAINLPSGAFIFGGMQSPQTSEYLPASDQTWQVGPTVPEGGIDRGCVVKVSPTEILLIGGYSGGRESDQVIKYTDGGA